MTIIFPIMHFKCFLREKKKSKLGLFSSLFGCVCVWTTYAFQFICGSLIIPSCHTHVTALCMFAFSSFRLFKYFSVGVVARVHLIYFFFPISHTLLGLHMAIMRRFDCHYQQHAQCSLRYDHLFILFVFYDHYAFFQTPTNGRDFTSQISSSRCH